MLRSRPIAVGMLAASALLLVGSKPAFAPNTWSLDTSVMGKCKKSDNTTEIDPDRNDILGVVRIRLPKKFSFEKLERGLTPGHRDVVVRYKRGAYDVSAQADEESGAQEGGDNTPEPTSGLQPFNIYYKLSKLNISAADRQDKFFLVRVIIKTDPDPNSPDNSNYRFYVGNGIYGVGKPAANDVICGAKDIVHLANTQGATPNRDVAQFFIRASKVLYPAPMPPAPLQDIPFNIVVAPNSATGTPIVIDPKIYNEG